MPLRRHTRHTCRALLGILPVLGAFSAAAQTVPPNVVLVIMDDTGVELFGAYNQDQQEVTGASPPEHAVTPNIDALARQGVLFRNVWSAPLCVPARAALLTSLYGYRTGVISNELGEIHVSPEVPSLPMRLRDHATNPYPVRRAIGKWHISPYQPYCQIPELCPNLEDAPTAYAFSRYDGALGSPSPYVNYSWLSDPPPDPLPDPYPPMLQEYMTSREIEEAISVVEGAPASPWFVWLALHAAHDPWTASETPDAPGSSCNEITTDAERRIRCRQLEIMDEELGALLDALDQDPSPEVLDLGNTTVILVGDNGSPRPQTGIEPIPDKVNRDHKRSLYEGGINVPLIIAGAGVGPQFVESEEIDETPALAHVVDVHATILDLAGVPSPNAWVDGVSMKGVLGGAAGPRTCVYTDGTTANANEPALPRNHGVAIRGSRFKLIRGRELTKNGIVEASECKDGHACEFFDLQADPGEQSPLPLSGPNFNALNDTLDALDANPTGTSVCKPGSPPGCGLGFELAPLLLLLRAAWRRHRGGA